MKPKVIIYIDTTESTQTKVVLLRNHRKRVLSEMTDPMIKSQNVLPLIEKALSSQGLELPDITEIKVNPGPGSFTGTRVGAAVANALGWVLGIPVNGKKIVVPEYAQSKFD